MQDCLRFTAWEGSVGEGGRGRVRQESRPFLAFKIFCWAAEGGRDWRWVSGRVLPTLSGKCSSHFCPRLIGQNLVTWPHPTARCAGKCSLFAGPSRKGSRVFKYVLVSKLCKTFCNFLKKKKKKKAVYFEHDFVGKVWSPLHLHGMWNPSLSFQISL